MAHTETTITYEELKDIAEDPSSGAISLIGEDGNSALITGAITNSSLIPGMISIEIEHGTIITDPEAYVTISEDDGRRLDDRREESVHALQKVLSHFLSETFSWHADSDDDKDLLSALVHDTANDVDDLLSASAQQTAV